LCVSFSLDNRPEKKQDFHCVDSHLSSSLVSHLISHLSSRISHISSISHLSIIQNGWRVGGSGGLGLVNECAVDWPKRMSGDFLQNSIKTGPKQRARTVLDQFSLAEGNEAHWVLRAVLISPHQSSVLISPHQSSSVLISPHQSSSVLSSPQQSSAVLSSPQQSS
jgi:hypothetical protein